MVTFQQGAKTIPQFLWRFREEFQIDCTFQELVMRDLRTIKNNSLSQKLVAFN